MLILIITILFGAVVSFRHKVTLRHTKKQESEMRFASNKMAQDEGAGSDGEEESSEDDPDGVYTRF